MRSSWRDPPEFAGGPQLAMPRLTPAVRALLLANAVVFGVHFVVYLLQPSGAVALALQDVLGVSPWLWIDWFPFVPVWQVVTWGFLHSLGDPMHLLFNMLAVYLFGTMLEGIVGSRRFLTTYLVAVVLSGLATLLVGLVAGTRVPTVGASGAVMCVVVAMAVLRPNTRVIFILFPLTLKTLALLFVGLDVFSALLQLKGVNSNVAHLAHLTGAAWGYLIVRRGWVWRDPLETLEARAAARQSGRERSDEARLDELLKKIQDEGIHSLSMRERAFLKRVSKRR